MTLELSGQKFTTKVKEDGGKKPVRSKGFSATLYLVLADQHCAARAVLDSGRRWYYQNMKRRRIAPDQIFKLKAQPDPLDALRRCGTSGSLL